MVCLMLSVVHKSSVALRRAGRWAVGEGGRRECKDMYMETKNMQNKKIKNAEMWEIRQ